ncbi:SDR family NAD(P)-dependent oxidoreductase [Cognatiluteimonas lumbrici]|uniref:SDR family NAD(P)-dependent oxidoreductase n=1 Tax=Cognatiluteimonas lumbrici TaxID=2559601 RepID=UPI00112D1977|nr:SDR family oxidoreductase [Luteimonas lumbrici]
MEAIIITGAAGGIGRELVRVLREGGYAAIAVDRVARPEGMECDGYVQCDIRRTVEDASYAEETFGRIRGALGGAALKALVNNAAVQVVAPLQALTREDWRATLDVNVIAPFIWAQAFLGDLEANEGCVLNVSSIHARLTKPEFVAYATSKAALSGMTRAMAVEFGHKVRVNAIEPAAIDTEMLRAGFAGRNEEFSRLADCHPVRRIGTPEEVARLALVLIAGRIAFLNGASIALDGGIGNRLHDTA